MPEFPPVWTIGPLHLPYQPAWDLQRRLQQARIESLIPDVLLLMEHDPVITLGRAANSGNVLWSEADLRGMGIELAQVERGGDVTYHGPGQITGYPILDLQPRGKDLGGYLRGLEEVMLCTLARFGIPGKRVEGFTGAWVGEHKIGAIGVKVRSWVTLHGFSFNVDPDLDHFQLIIPCGLVDKGVTSLRRLLGEAAPSLEAVGEELGSQFSRVFQVRLERLSLAELENRLDSRS